MLNLNNSSARGSQLAIPRFLYLSIVPLAFLVSISITLFTSPPSQPVDVTTRTVADIAPEKPALFQYSTMALTQEGIISQINVQLALTEGMAPIQIGQDALMVDYRDNYQHEDKIRWDYLFTQEHDNDFLLEAGELVEIQIPLDTFLEKNLRPGDEFAIDIKPLTSPILTIHRTIPAQLDSLTYLN